MRLNAKALLLASVACLSMAPFDQGFAGGLMLYETAGDNVGLANAGAAARAQGPSTIASNPAGLSYLEGTQVSAGGQVLFGDLHFERDASRNTSGSGSGNVLEPIPAASFFISHALSDPWVIGFGAYGDFGLAQHYNDGWSGRYFVQRASIMGLSLVPSVAYRINEQWSLGVGVKAMYGSLKYEAAINQAPLARRSGDDGQYRYDDGTWGYGFNAGVIYAPQAGTRIGLAYTSQVDLSFDQRLQVKAGGPLLSHLDGLTTQLDLSVPQTLTLSLYRQLGSQWALLASANWQDWSRFGDVGVQLDSTLTGARATTLDARFKDTYQLAIGAQYQANERMRWDFGMAYDSSAVADAHRTLTVPMGAAWRFATGMTYALERETDLNFSWVTVWMNDLPVEQQKSWSGDRTSGQFSNAWLHAVSASLVWRFR